MRQLHIYFARLTEGSKSVELSLDFGRGYELCDIRDEMESFIEELVSAQIMNDERVDSKIAEIKELLEMD